MPEIIAVDRLPTATIAGTRAVPESREIQSPIDKFEQV